ncbi:hypothetical protein EV714DRAFT_284581 [Schizophyllum commune]
MSDTQKNDFSLPPDPNTDDELSIPTLPRVVTSTRLNKVSSQPAAILSALRADAGSKKGGGGGGGSMPLGILSFGHHDTMDGLLAHELSDTIATDVEGLTERLFRDDDFIVTLKTVFSEMQTGSTPMYSDGRWNFGNLRQTGVERQFATFLDRLGERAREIYAAHDHEVEEIRRWSADFCDQPLSDGLVPRKPDLSLVPEGATADWKSHYVDGQLKSSTKYMKDASAQLHDGALNTFAAQDERLFHIGIAFIGPLCFINCCDRSGCLQLKPIDIHAKPLEFLRIFLGLTILDKSKIGFDHTIIHRDNKRYIVVNGEEYEILENLANAAGLLGLGSAVWSCKTKSSEHFVMKSSWSDRSRAHTEDFYLKRANEAGVQGVPTFVAFSRVHHQGKPLSTVTIREGLKYRENCTAVFDVRDLTRLVIKERGVPIHRFASKTEFLSAIRDVVKAHEELYHKAKTLHTDIHDKNIILVDVSASVGSLRKGILIDHNYDLLLDELHTRTEASSGIRSGAAVFVAPDILTYPKSVKPALRYDLQSILCLIIWTCVCYSGPGTLRDFRLKDSKIAGWLQISEFYTGLNKSAILGLKQLDGFGDFMHETFHKYWHDVKRCVWDIRQIVMRDDPLPTHGEVLQVLDKHIPRIYHIEKVQGEQQKAILPSDPALRVSKFARGKKDEPPRRSARHRLVQEGTGSTAADQDSPYFEGKAEGRVVQKKKKKVE